MLLDPTARPDTADLPSAPTSASGSPARPTVPDALAALARRARSDRASALALVAMLFDRGWGVEDIDAVTDISRGQIRALAGVRRVRTASSEVADGAVARHRRVPHPRQG